MLNVSAVVVASNERVSECENGPENEVPEGSWVGADMTQEGFAISFERAHARTEA